MGSRSDDKRPAASGASPFTMQLSESVKLRLSNFMHRGEFSGKSQSDIVEVLLDLAETHPDTQTYHYAVKKRKIADDSACAVKAVTVSPNRAMNSSSSSSVRYPAVRDETSLAIEYLGIYESLNDSENHFVEYQSNNRSNDYYESSPERVVYSGDIDYESEAPVALGTQQPSDRTESSKAVSKVKKTRKAKKKPPFQSGDGLLLSLAGYYCYEVILKRRRNAMLQCRKCELWVQASDPRTGWVRSRSAFNHVCRHLGKQMFACRICQHRSNTVAQILQHLSTNHKEYRMDFVLEFTEQYSQDIRQMVLDCFDWESTADPPESRRPLKNSFRSTLLYHCRLLIDKFCTDKRISCLKCGYSFVVISSYNIPKTGVVLDHALSHIGRDVCRCRLCPKQTTTATGMRAHIHHAHPGVRATKYDDFSDAYRDEILPILDECFDASVGGGSTDNMPIRRAKDSLKTAISTIFCHEVLKKRQRNGLIRCHECGQWLRAKETSGQIRCRVPFYHACGHLSKQIFACKHCAERCNSQASIRAHLRRCHGHACIKDFTVDLTNEDKSALKEMVSKCFDWDDNNDVEPLRLRRGYTSASLKIQQHCRDLITKYAVDGHLVCRRCGVRISAITIDGWRRTKSLISHANNHLGRVLYSCRLCSKQASSLNRISAHIEREHRGHSVAMYSDQSDEFLDEILFILSDCYDTSARCDRVDTVSVIIDMVASAPTENLE